jgi:hypothetical protein
MNKFGEDTTDIKTVANKTRQNNMQSAYNEKKLNLYSYPERIGYRQNLTLSEKVRDIKENEDKNKKGSGKNSDKLTKLNVDIEVPKFKETKYKKQVPVVGGGNVDIAKTTNSWKNLIKQTMNDQKLSMKDSIKYIKNNNLYKK